MLLLEQGPSCGLRVPGEDEHEQRHRICASESILSNTTACSSPISCRNHGGIIQNQRLYESYRNLHGGREGEREVGGGEEEEGLRETSDPTPPTLP